jgi:hypothetical protein
VSKVRVQLDELKAALAEIEGRTNDLKVTIEFDDRKLRISAADRGENIVEAVLYEDGNLGAQFRCTERLMFMKDKKRI